VRLHEFLNSSSHARHMQYMGLRKLSRFSITERMNGLLPARRCLLWGMRFSSALDVTGLWPECNKMHNRSDYSDPFSHV
jgi:hypothetical protein